MFLLAAIFRFEWRRLVRSRMLLGSLVAFSLLSVLAIHNGRQGVNIRLGQLDSIQAAYQRDFQVHWQKISDTSAAGRKKAAVDGLAEVINYRLPQMACWYPQSLQTLSTGISDIQPFYHTVQTTVSYLDPPNIPVSNPVKLFAGNFDLAFVWLYILPLLITGLCFPLYAEEKEAGTAALLSVQGSSLRRIMGYKWLFRTGLISLLVALLNAAGILAIPGRLTPHTATLGWWCWIVQLYVLMWCALTWLVVALRLSGSLTALLLTGCWLLAVMVLPALANMFAATQYAIPLRSELASLQREESEQIWSMPPGSLADSFNVAHPQYASSAQPAIDTVFGSRRFVAGYYYLLEKRVGQAAATLDSQLMQRNQYFNQLAAANPVLRTQQLLNLLAGTTLADHRHYRQQVSAFQKQWKSFLYPWQLAGKPLGREQFSQFPVFTPVSMPLSANHLMKDCWLLYVLILAPALTGFFLFNSHERP